MYYLAVITNFRLPFLVSHMATLRLTLNLLRRGLRLVILRQLQLPCHILHKKLLVHVDILLRSQLLRVTDRWSLLLHHINIIQ